MMIICLVIGIALGLMLGFLIGQYGVAKPLSAIVDLLQSLAEGHFDINIDGTDRKDEIGHVAKTALVFKENGLAKIKMEAEQKEAEQRAIIQRKQDMIKLADQFQGAVGEIIETVSSASTELEASASTLTATAVRAQEITTTVAAASEEASTNVQAVASATEEMASSVNEIGRQVQKLARMAGEAVDQARKTNDRVSELSKAAARIGDVVELINTIAGQTNLLALNATIEAARAGEAGRGFAVVASEVKALAEQTAKATGEIGQQITGIQAATQEFGQRHQGDQQHHRAAVGDFVDHRSRGGGAGRSDAGDFPQRTTSCARHPASLFQHYRRPARRRRDGIGIFPGALSGAVTLPRQHPLEARGRRVPQHGARRLKR